MLQENVTMKEEEEEEEDLMGYITVSPYDKSKFKFPFKSTTSCKELVNLACERAGIKQAEYFGLKRLRNFRSQLPEEEVPLIWMSEKRAIGVQGCDSSTVLFLRHKYWFRDVDELHDPITLQFIYEEINDKMMGNDYDCNEDFNIQLATCRALLLFPHLGKATLFIEENLKQMLPDYILHLHPIEEWQRLISVFYESLKHESKEALQKKFLALAKEGCPSLQITYFPAQYSSRDMETRVTILVGTSAEGVGFYTYKNFRKKLVVFHRFGEISSWNVNSLWNGLESPDFEKPLPGDACLTFEKDPFAIGPFLCQLTIKVRTKTTKEIEVDLASFVSRDDSILAFVETYNERRQQFLTLALLDDQAKELNVQVTTLTEISKRIKITSETNGQELLEKFAEKIGLTDKSFFQLSAVIDHYDRWIAFKDTVISQGITASTKLTLKVRFFWKNPAEISDPVAQQLYFTQIHYAITNGDFLIGEKDVLELAGLNLQYIFGPHIAHKRYAWMNEVSIKDYIPYYLLQLHTQASWEKKLQSAHESVSNLTKEQALAKYLLTASIVPNYGITFFSGIIPKIDEECYIGVGKLGLALYHAQKMTVVAGYRFGYELRAYINVGETIRLKVKPSKHADPRVVLIVSLQFAEILDLMAYYEKMRKLEKTVNSTNEDD